MFLSQTNKIQNGIIYQAVRLERGEEVMVGKRKSYIQMQIPWAINQNGCYINSFPREDARRYRFLP